MRDCDRYMVDVLHCDCDQVIDEKEIEEVVKVAEQTKVGIIIPPLGCSFPHLRMDWGDDEQKKGEGPFSVESQLPVNYLYKEQLKKHAIGETELETRKKRNNSILGRDSTVLFRTFLIGSMGDTVCF